MLIEKQKRIRQTLLFPTLPSYSVKFHHHPHHQVCHVIKRHADTVRRNLRGSLTKPRNMTQIMYRKELLCRKNTCRGLRERTVWSAGFHRRTEMGEMWGIQRERDPARHKRTWWELHTRRRRKATQSGTRKTFQYSFPPLPLFLTVILYTKHGLTVCVCILPVLYFALEKVKKGIFIRCRHLSLFAFPIVFDTKHSKRFEFRALSFNFAYLPSHTNSMFASLLIAVFF